MAILPVNNPRKYLRNSVSYIRNRQDACSTGK